jgi:hypothetical protein
LQRSQRGIVASGFEISESEPVLQMGVSAASGRWRRLRAAGLLLDVPTEDSSAQDPDWLADCPERLDERVRSCQQHGHNRRRPERPGRFGAALERLGIGPRRRC